MQAENVGLPNDSDDNGDNYDDDHDDKIKYMVGNYAHQSWVYLPLSASHLHPGLGPL